MSAHHWRSKLFRCVLILTALWGVVGMASATPFSDLYVQPDPMPPTSQRFVTPTVDEPPIMNPPGFRWVDIRWDAYDLQISRGPDFPPENTIEVIGWPLPIYMPDRPLETGKWYWRVRPHSDIGLWQDRWTETYSFEIVNGLPSVPIPDMDTLLQRLDDIGRPRLYMTPETLAAWREKIVTTHRLTWYALSARLEQSMLVDKTDPHGLAGASVTNPDTVDDYNTAVNRANRLSESMQLLALSYLLTGDERHGKAAREQLLALASWDPDGATSARTNNTAFREVLVGLARGFDWLSATDILTEDDRRTIVDMAERRGRAYYEWYRSSSTQSIWPYESHRGGGLGFFVEFATAFAGVIPESTDWLRYTLHMLTANYPPYGRSDGSWSEGGWYWSFTIDLHLPTLMGISPAIGVDMTAHPFFGNTGYYALYALPPWAKLTPYGDDYHLAPAAAHMRVAERLAWLQDKPYFTWYARQFPFSGFGHSATAFLLFETAPAAQSPDDLPLARVFPDTGLAVLRTSLSDPDTDVHFSIKSNPFGSVSHAHADQGNFALFAYGEQLVRPSGYYPLYGDDHHATWSRQSWAHNVPLFDGRGQATRTDEALGQIEHFYTSTANLVDYVRVEAGRAYRATTPGSATRQLDGYMPGLSQKVGSVPVADYHRHVVFLRPDALVIFDEASTYEPMAFEWQMHTDQPAQFAGDQRSLHTLNNDVGLHVAFFGPERIVLTQDTDYTFPATGRHADLPDQWHIKARVEDVAADHRFVAVLLPHRKDEDVAEVSELDGDGFLGVALHGEGNVTRVAFAVSESSERNIRLHPGTADARVLVVNEGESRWLYAAETRRLVLQGVGDWPAGEWTFSDPVDVMIYADEVGFVLDVTAAADTALHNGTQSIEIMAGQTRIQL